MRWDGASTINLNMKKPMAILALLTGALLLAVGSAYLLDLIRLHKYGFSLFIPTGRSDLRDYQRGHELYSLYNPGYKIIIGVAQDKNWVVNFAKPTKPVEVVFFPFVTVYHNEHLEAGQSRSYPVLSTR